jgi:hypothetical protein
MPASAAHLRVPLPRRKIEAHDEADCFRFALLSPSYSQARTCMYTSYHAAPAGAQLSGQTTWVEISDPPFASCMTSEHHLGLRLHLCGVGWHDNLLARWQGQLTEAPHIRAPSPMSGRSRCSLMVTCHHGHTYDPGSMCTFVVNTDLCHPKSLKPKEPH